MGMGPGGPGGAHGGPGGVGAGFGMGGEQGMGMGPGGPGGPESMPGGPGGPGGMHGGAEDMGGSMDAGMGGMGGMGGGMPGLFNPGMVPPLLASAFDLMMGPSWHNLAQPGTTLAPFPFGVLGGHTIGELGGVEAGSECKYVSPILCLLVRE